MASVKPARQERTWKTASGQVLTEADIEAIADEAERGYDLSTARRIILDRGGRPPLGNAGPSPRLSFRASQALYDAAVALAERQHRSVSALAREAVERYVAGAEQ